MRAAAGSAASAQMADIDIANTERSQELQYRRQQMLQSLAGLGSQDLAARMQYAVNLGQLGLGHRQLTEQMALGWAEHAQKGQLGQLNAAVDLAGRATTDWYKELAPALGLAAPPSRTPRYWDSHGNPAVWDVSGGSRFGPIA